MAKYIDADRLKAEIRKALDEEGSEDAYEEGYDAACFHILMLIRSLQEEQT